MKIKNPKVGPVLGYTTGTSARFWAGLKTLSSKKPYKINCGRIRYRLAGSGEWSEAKAFRFNRNFYWTGVIEIHGLEVGKKYEYQLGYVAKYEENPETLEWDDCDIHEFYTVGEEGPFEFFMGSCLRPHKADDRLDKVFEFVKNYHMANPVKMMLWMGDQIYNDMYLWATPKNSDEDDFSRRYARFYKNKHIERVVPQIPNYMLMDDHEIADGFTEGIKDYATSGVEWIQHNEERALNGVTAFYAYQASHSPIFDAKLAESNVAFIKGQGDYQVPVKHHYELDYGDIGFYMLDCRMERDKHDMISDEQMKALKTFLSKDYRVKFIASSVTFLADYKSQKVDDADNWKRSTKQRKEILEHILDNDLKNIFFLSGDVHANFAASLEFDGETKAVHQVVAGSLFWPVSFKTYNPITRAIGKIRWFRKDVNFGKSIEGVTGAKLSQPVAIDRYATEEKDYYPSNGIGHIKIVDNKLRFTVFDAKGNEKLASDFELV